jgi:trimethylamine--corrinoid protein Co-methyltransferase
MVDLSVLSKDDLESIHQATLRILSEVGIVLSLPAGRDILAGAGCSINTDRVFFPPDLVENALAECPSQVTVRGRGGQGITLGDGSLHWHNLGGARDVINADGGNRRPAVIQDVRDSTRLLDALDQVTSVTPLFTPQDVPGEMMSLAMYRHCLPHTTKPVQGPGVQTAAEVRYAVQMAEVIGPAAEYLSLSVSPVSPLIFHDDVVEAIIAIADAGVPFAPLPCPIAGATAPLSIAGALAQQNAETLAALILAQLVHPGLPFVYCGRLAMMEPRTGLSVWGGVELGLTSAATVQLAHRYNLPVNVYGFATNAHGPDIQSGFERALNAALPALAGADELSGIGELEAGVLSSFTQIVLDNELAASIQRLVRGFVADEYALGVDVIAAAMDGSRNFLGQRHTVDFLRAGEVMVTELAERRSGEEWERSGRKGMTVRAQAEADRLLKDHEIPPLESAQTRALDEISQAAVAVFARDRG